jgi:nitrous oxide reductase accessory protein NosL
MTRRPASLMLAAAPAVLMLAAGALIGCSRGELSGPPELRVGRDECIECGMLIAEDRSSTAMLVDRRGRREYIMFDDLGCMLDFQREKGGPEADFKELELFVRDHPTGGWVPAAEAWYLLADRHTLITPMGSGLASFATEQTAREWHGRHGGELMRWNSIGEARRVWFQAMYGRENP